MKKTAILLAMLASTYANAITVVVPARAPVFVAPRPAVAPARPAAPPPKAPTPPAKAAPTPEPVRPAVIPAPVIVPHVAPAARKCDPKADKDCKR